MTQQTQIPQGWSHKAADGWTPGLPEFRDTIRVHNWREKKRYETVLTLCYRAPDKFTLLVPAGYRTDLRTFPFLKDGADWAACVVHDYALDSTNIPTRRCDRLYLSAMIDSGVPRAMRRTFYLGVRLHSILLKRRHRDKRIYQSFEAPAR